MIPTAAELHVTRRSPRPRDTVTAAAYLYRQDRVVKALRRERDERDVVIRELEGEPTRDIDIATEFDSSPELACGANRRNHGPSRGAGVEK